MTIRYTIRYNTIMKLNSEGIDVSKLQKEIDDICKTLGRLAFMQWEMSGKKKLEEIASLKKLYSEKAFTCEHLDHFKEVPEHINFCPICGLERRYI